MKKYRVVVIGAGMVGKKMVEILIERNFPAESLKIFATREREEFINGKIFKIKKTEINSFDNVDIAFFAGTEGEKGASRIFGWDAVKKGTIVIDNGADFRMDPRVPLVVPEVNPEVLKHHQGFIANPNCSTIQMVVALYPLHKIFNLQKVIVSTYQAVSGTGIKAVNELKKQTEEYTEGKECKPDVYHHQILFNILPHIGNQSEKFEGCFTEEEKMINETKKIMNLPKLKVSATCVRVPVYNAHCESITAQFEKSIDEIKARKILSEFPGIIVMDEPEKNVYPTPLIVSGKDEVFIGRIRKNHCLENSLDMWVVADNIRKGAALNAVQIAENLIL